MQVLNNNTVPYIQFNLQKWAVFQFSSVQFDFIPKFRLRRVLDSQDSQMSTEYEYFSCKGMRVLWELNLVVECILASIVDSTRDLNCQTGAIIICIQKRSWLLDISSKEHKQSQI